MGGGETTLRGGRGVGRMITMGASQPNTDSGASPLNFLDLGEKIRLDFFVLGAPQRRRGSVEWSGTTRSQKNKKQQHSNRHESEFPFPSFRAPHVHIHAIISIQFREKRVSCLGSEIFGFVVHPPRRRKVWYIAALATHIITFGTRYHNTPYTIHTWLSCRLSNLQS